MKKSSHGFTIIELMIFISVLSIVLIAAISFTTRLIANMQVTRHQVLANFYAEDLKEWLYSEQLADWATFVSKARTGDGYTYCINNAIALTDRISDLPTAGECANFNGIYGMAPAIFKRQVTLISNDSGTSVTAVINIYWMDNDVQYNVRVDSFYTQWN